MDSGKPGNYKKPIPHPTLSSAACLGPRKRKVGWASFAGRSARAQEPCKVCLPSPKPQETSPRWVGILHSTGHTSVRPFNGKNPTKLLGLPSIQEVFGPFTAKDKTAAVLKLRAIMSAVGYSFTNGK